MDILLNERDPKSMLFFSLILLWTIFWKGFALWNAGKREARLWFVFLLILNTFGILEIIYIFFVLKLKPRDLFAGKQKVAVEDKKDSTENK